jgi:hypothetical protein
MTLVVDEQKKDFLQIKRLNLIALKILFRRENV